MVVEHTFITAEGHETRVLNKAKAIRLKCLDCACWQRSEVERCICYDCALYPFRFGNEKGLERKYIPEEHDEPDDEIEEDELEFTSIEIKKPKLRKIKKIRKIKK